MLNCVYNCLVSRSHSFFLISVKITLLAFLVYNVHVCLVFASNSRFQAVCGLSCVLNRSQNYYIPLIYVQFVEYYIILAHFQMSLSINLLCK